MTPGYLLRIIPLIFLVSTVVAAKDSDYIDSLTGIEFVLIKGGCFSMGDVFKVGEPDENPVHEICVDDFYLGKYEITQKQWSRVMKNNPSAYPYGDRYPVEWISWNDA